MLKWAVGTFGPYKAPGGYISPIMLKQGLEMLALLLCKLLRVSLALDYIPRCWQEAGVVFIPKTGRTQNGSVKDFRSSSLTFLILKL